MSDLTEEQLKILSQSKLQKVISHVTLQGNWLPLFRFLGWFWTGNRFFWNGLVSVTHEADEFSYELQHPNETRGGNRGPNFFLLNHIAISTANIDATKEYWEQELGVQNVLHIKDGWDNVEQHRYDAVHIYQPEQIYLTLRAEEPEGLHHFGFEVTERKHMSLARAILHSIEWPIVWEGEIDESFVIHFKGPDGRVHDFFCTTSRLRHRARAHP